MAGNKGNTKSKTKDDKTRMNKGPSTSNLNYDLEDCDLSLLRKPIQTSISSFAQARKIYDIATEELKNLLSNECDLLYECKVCKNIFRSVVNLLSHKRIYCKEKYNPSDHGKRIGNISLMNEVSKIKRIEEEYQESMKKLQSHEPHEENRIPLTKDLTTVVEEITKVNGVPEKHIEEKMHNVTFQTIPSSKVAVFQNVTFNEDDLCTDMRSELTELQEILSKNKAVLQPGGKFSTESSISSCKDSSEVENVIQISDDEETDESDKLKCKICNLQLSTQKTLKFHMKYKHLDSRLVYPCPDCFDIFATSWSVYRHLYKVHRKSAAQIRRQRESIQAKAFRMNNPPAYYEKKKNNMKAAAASKVTDVEKFDRDNQAWMDNMEGDGEVPRCGGCGRTFERRAALAAHTHTCQPRNRALARRPLDSKRIEIQIRKDYNKGPNQLAHNNGSSEALNAQVNTEDDMEIDSVNHDDLLKTSSKTQNLANNAKEDKLKSNNSEQNLEDDMEAPDVLNALVDDVKQFKAFNSTSKKDQNANVTLKDENRDIEALDNPNKNTTDISDNLSDVKKENVIQETVSNSKISHNNLPFYKHVEENNIAGLKQKMEPDIDLHKLQCKKCFIKFIYMHELCFHMAHHYNWKRYSCKLCNFKHYLFDAVIEHNKIVHKLKGDREFYYTTVKALDSADAIDPNLVDDINDNNTTNIDSRRPSRCSNDSSRSSDDSTAYNIRTEIITNKRKRKLPKSQNNAINKEDSPVTPKKGETTLSTKMPLDKVMEIILGEPETPPKSVSDQERSKDDNLSDIEDSTEKSTKRLTNEESILTTRVSRPIRKRIRPKNEDFEYDLSNLLKLEAQGYREQQVGVSSRTLQIKRKSQNDVLNSEIATFNVKDVSGVLLNMSRKAVEEARAHLKLITTPVVVCNNAYIKQRVTKTAPAYKTGTPNANVSLQDSSSKTDSDICKPESKTSEEKLDSNVSLPHLPSNAKSLIKNSDSVSEPVAETNEMLKEIPNEQSKTSETSDNKTDIKVKNSITPNSGNARPLVCQSVVNPNEVLKNPLVSQNITEFAKAGMTTKFVLIKPVNRDLASQDITNRPLKLKTIKIKDLETKTKVSTLEQMKFLKIASGDSSTLSKDKTDVIDSDKKKQEIARKQNISPKNLETDNTT